MITTIVIIILIISITIIPIIIWNACITEKSLQSCTLSRFRVVSTMSLEKWKKNVKLFHSSRKMLITMWNENKQKIFLFLLLLIYLFFPPPNDPSNTKDATVSTSAAIFASIALSTNRKRWKPLGAGEFSTSTTEETGALLLFHPLTCGRLNYRGVEAASIIKKKIKEIGSQPSAEADDTINQMVNYGPEVEGPQE